ncbi:MAG: hypothetical protein LBK94_04215 [Prevotellaceae bacterium]|nr:hypothetical protein [Prevotellaceae bacterium]
MAITVCVIMSSCGSSKAAKTPQQKAAIDRGVKMEKEECEQLALKDSRRASESATASRNSLPKIRQPSSLISQVKSRRRYFEQCNLHQYLRTAQRQLPGVCVRGNERRNHR